MNKTVITGPYLMNGGVAQFIKNISPFFKNKVIVFKRGKRKSADKFGFIYPFTDVLRFIFFLLKENPGKVIINSSFAKVGIIRDGFFVAFSKMMGIRTVLFIHGFNEKDLNHKLKVKKGYFKADMIFVLSSDFKTKLMDLGRTESMDVSYNPIGADLISSPDRNFKESKSGKRIKILMMSRIEASKGIFIGLELMKNLRKENIEMHIAGTGSGLENAREFVNDHQIDNVHFHGFISGDDKKNLLADCDILLFPTFHKEGLPINILESLAMGLYVVSRPVAGINDLNRKYHMNLTESVLSKDFELVVKDLLQNGLPVEELIENQKNAKIDFSPHKIFNQLNQA